ncbi:MAG: hypothetical protein R2857_01035 [Vampirovibrionales bacterium]
MPASEPAFSPTGVTQDYIPVDPGLTVDTPTMGALKAVDDNPQPKSNRYKANAMVARLESGPGNDWAFGIVDDFATAHSHPAGDRSVEEAVQAGKFLNRPWPMPKTTAIPRKRRNYCAGQPATTPP